MMADCNDVPADPEEAAAVAAAAEEARLEYRRAKRARDESGEQSDTATSPTRVRTGANPAPPSRLRESGPSAGSGDTPRPSAIPRRISGNTSAGSTFAPPAATVSERTPASGSAAPRSQSPEELLSRYMTAMEKAEAKGEAGNVAFWKDKIDKHYAYAVRVVNSSTRLRLRLMQSCSSRTVFLAVRVLQGAVPMT